MNLGATEARAFRSITLPIVRPGLFAGFIFAFMASFQNLPATVFVVQPGTYTLPVILFGYIRDEFNPIVAVVTVVMVLVAGLTMLAADRFVGIYRFMGLHGGHV
jgi:putative spermidine/putrescine transport system permease protein